MVKFTATIHLLGINPCVYVPDDVVNQLYREAKKEKGNIPVEGRINNAVFITTVVKYAGAWRLYLNSGIRLDTGLGVGDIVTIELMYDPKPREIELSLKFAEALSQNESAKAAFERLPLSRQKEILSYLNWLKTDEALERNVKKVIQMLLD